jgi:hypothetical protein
MFKLKYAFHGTTVTLSVEKSTDSQIRCTGVSTGCAFDPGHFEIRIAETGRKHALENWELYIAEASQNNMLFFQTFFKNATILNPKPRI